MGGTNGKDRERANKVIRRGEDIYSLEIIIKKQIVVFVETKSVSMFLKRWKIK